MKIRLAALLLCCTAGASAQTDTQALVNARLVEALTCGADSLDIVRSLATKPEAIAPFGMAVVANNGEGYDEKIDISLRDPLQLGEATSTKVTLAFENPFKEFGALVFAEFKGDPAAMVRHLGLVPGKTASYAIGRYVSRNARSGHCPAHVGMSVLGKDRFVLGCGWCNG